jgi:phosphatidylinositol alpha-1,6-mannosyltransferase
VEIPRTLVLTNDFPPRVGGVQRYVHDLVRHLPPDRVTVLAPRWPGWRDFDAAQPFRVVRFPTTTLWPTGELAARARSLVRETRAHAVLFGHALPLGLLAPGLARLGVPSVMCTHGTEYWLAIMPGTASLLRRASAGASRVLAVSRYTGRVIRTAVPGRVPLSLLPPGVDAERFRPDAPGAEGIRRRHRIGERPLVVCVSRLVPRKGQDVLIRAMPAIRRRVPDARLLVVGGGPDAARVRALAADADPGTVVLADQVPDEELPAYHAAADVFAMPCRSRLGGLEVEGFGIVYLEAAASGRPCVAGRSGGAPEAVVDGETGLVVDGGHIGAVAEAVSALLADPGRAAAMGKAGRGRVEREFAWPALAERLAGWLRAAVG